MCCDPLEKVQGRDCCIVVYIDKDLSTTITQYYSIVRELFTTTTATTTTTTTTTTATTTTTTTHPPPPPPQLNGTKTSNDFKHLFINQPVLSCIAIITEHEGWRGALA